MNPRRSTTNARARSIAAARAAATKNAADTVVLDVGDIIGITDAFVITSGNNVRQVKTIAEEVERQLKDQGEGKPLQIEGLSDASWVLLDYGDFVVHVFNTETRGYYDLERLWADAPRIGWDEATAAVS
ncbi:MAG: ribosome silencing factor [Acidimicrobiia bacterium]